MMTEREDIIKTYLESKALVASKIDIRPWGTYSPSASWDGVVFATFPRPFGFGFQPIEAVSICVADHLENNTFGPEFDGWLGEERRAELLALLPQPNEPIILPPTPEAEPPSV